MMGSIFLGGALMVDAMLLGGRGYGETYGQRKLMRWAEFPLGGFLFFAVPYGLEQLL